MQKTKIDWCTHVLNPYVGCRRGCTYCYARTLHNKRHKAKLSGKKLPDCYLHRFEDVKFYPERLNALSPRQKPATVFLNSVSDPEYWEPSHWKQIMHACERCPQHTFMILTKNPECYLGFDVAPDNVMLGCTITGGEPAELQRKKVISLWLFSLNYFISIEPLVGKIDIPLQNLQWGMKKLIVGAMTKNASGEMVAPKLEWVKPLLDLIPSEKIVLKKNILKYPEFSEYWDKKINEG